jgi:hypothetical protein
VGSSLAKIAVVAEIKNDGICRAELAKDYTELSPSDATPIGSGAAQVNSGVREAIGTAGQGREYDTLIRRDTTQAERRFSINNRVGDVSRRMTTRPACSAASSTASWILAPASAHGGGGARPVHHVLAHDAYQAVRL